MQVTIFTANCIGQAANCSYPNKVTVVTPEQLREAVKADHVCAFWNAPSAVSKAFVAVTRSTA